MAILSFTEVSKLLKADFETGQLFWLPRTPDMFEDGAFSREHCCAIWNSQNAGRIAFTVQDNLGYRHGSIYGRPYLAHRVIWMMHTGYWPTGDIDHINGDPSDNRPSNLRSVSRAENLKNQKTPKTNTSGVQGVVWEKSRRKWRAQIKVGGSLKHLGRFDNIEDAAAARKAAQIKYAFHENHGRSK